MSSMDGSTDQSKGQSKCNSIQELKPQDLPPKKTTVKTTVKTKVHKSLAPNTSPSVIAPYYQRPTLHPNFDPKQTPLDPDRPLSDIPSPARREQTKLDRIYDATMSALYASESAESKSPWDLLVSPSLAAHLELLQLGNLIDLPASFTQPFANADTYPLLPALAKLPLLDMTDIYQAQEQVKQAGYILTRYGIHKARARSKHNDAKLVRHTEHKEAQKVHTATTKPHANKPSYADVPEMINDVFAPEWELILYPEHFDNGVDSLETDTLACSVAVHILKQCQTRKTVNTHITAKQICQHMRSYVLSQCRLYAHKCERYRQIRLFEGHVIVATHYLGLASRYVQVHDAHQEDSKQQDDKNGNNSDNNSNSDASLANPEPHRIDGNTNYEVYFNISSRNSLFVRYPNITDYFINGWT